MVKTTIFLTSMADFAAVNEVYKAYVGEPYPARSTFAVAALPMGAKVEIEMIASRSAHIAATRSSSMRLGDAGASGIRYTRVRSALG